MAFRVILLEPPGDSFGERGSNRIKMGIASEVVYEVESVKTQSIPPIPQLLGVKKKNGARANQTGRRFHRWLGGL